MGVLKTAADTGGGVGWGGVFGNGYAAMNAEAFFQWKQINTNKHHG